MLAKRYSLILADRTTGVVRRATIAPRPIVAAVMFAFLLPILVAVALVWTTEVSVAQLRTRQASLELENENYRAATDALTGQIQSLQAAIDELGVQSALEPALADAMDSLPSLVRSRAMGGGLVADPVLAVDGIPAPEETFGLLSTVLEGLELRLHDIRDAVERRNALAAATPSIWPAYGWLSSRLGGVATRSPAGETIIPGSTLRLNEANPSLPPHPAP